MTLDVLVVATIDPTLREIASMAIACDLGEGVEVRFDLGHEGDALAAVVSDPGGTVHTDWYDLDHGCLGCALRTGLVPTLRWIRDQHRWTSACLSLPPTLSPTVAARTIDQAVRVGDLEGVRLRQVVCALDETTFVEDLLGDHLVRERDLALGQHDTRAVGEALAGMLESSDLVVTLSTPDDQSDAMFHHVLGAQVSYWHGLTTLPIPTLLAGESLVPGLAPRWAPESLSTPCATERAGVWTLDLLSDKGFHPGRLLDQIELLGTGRVLARGCFWVPSRPDLLCAWDGSGGQLSIGGAARWGMTPRQTRLRITGTEAGERDRIRHAFRDVLLTDHEMAAAVALWQGRDDGLEPWLGEGPNHLHR